MTSSNGNIFRVTGHLCVIGICALPVPGEFPAQRPVTQNFDVFFDLRLNKRLSKQSWGWWFETLSRPLWRHFNDFSRYWTFVWGIHRSPVNSPHKGQWRGALMLSLICALNNRLSKHSWGWWFETPSYPLWCHCNGDKPLPEPLMRSLTGYICINVPMNQSEFGILIRIKLEWNKIANIPHIYKSL